MSEFGPALQHAQQSEELTNLAKEKSGPVADKLRSSWLQGKELPQKKQENVKSAEAKRQEVFLDGKQYEIISSGKNMSYVREILPNGKRGETRNIEKKLIDEASGKQEEEKVKKEQESKAQAEAKKELEKIKDPQILSIVKQNGMIKELDNKIAALIKESKDIKNIQKTADNIIKQIAEDEGKKGLSLDEAKTILRGRILKTHNEPLVQDQIAEQKKITDKIKILEQVKTPEYFQEGIRNAEKYKKMLSVGNEIPVMDFIEKNEYKKLTKQERAIFERERLKIIGSYENKIKSAEKEQNELLKKKDYSPEEGKRIGELADKIYNCQEKIKKLANVEALKPENERSIENQIEKMEEAIDRQENSSANSIKSIEDSKRRIRGDLGWLEKKFGKAFGLSERKLRENKKEKVFARANEQFVNMTAETHQYLQDTIDLMETSLLSLNDRLEEVKEGNVSCAEKIIDEIHKGIEKSVTLMNKEISRYSKAELVKNRAKIQELADLDRSLLVLKNGLRIKKEERKESRGGLVKRAMRTFMSLCNEDTRSAIMEDVAKETESVIESNKKYVEAAQSLLEKIKSQLVILNRGLGGDLPLPEKKAMIEPTEEKESEKEQDGEKEEQEPAAAENAAQLLNEMADIKNFSHLENVESKIINFVDNPPEKITKELALKIAEAYDQMFQKTEDWAKMSNLEHSNKLINAVSILRQISTGQIKEIEPIAAAKEEPGQEKPASQQEAQPANNAVLEAINKGAAGIEGLKNINEQITNFIKTKPDYEQAKKISEAYAKMEIRLPVSKFDDTELGKLLKDRTENLGKLEAIAKNLLEEKAQKPDGSIAPGKIELTDETAASPLSKIKIAEKGSDALPNLDEKTREQREGWDKEWKEVMGWQNHELLGKIKSDAEGTDKDFALIQYLSRENVSIGSLDFTKNDNTKMSPEEFKEYIGAIEQKYTGVNDPLSQEIKKLVEKINSKIEKNRAKTPEPLIEAKNLDEALQLAKITTEDKEELKNIYKEELPGADEKTIIKKALLDVFDPTINIKQKFGEELYAKLFRLNNEMPKILVNK